jgi:LysM repeat protein
LAQRCRADLYFGRTMKKPIVVFSSIAALAAAALGTTIYVKRVPEAPIPVVSATIVPAVPAAQPIQPKAVEPAAPGQQEAVAPPASADTEVAVAVPQPETAPAAPVAQPAAAPVVVTSLPSFDTVRVEATGDALIAGRAEPDSDVTVKWNGNVVGTTKANADGSFVLIPASPLKTGIGAMTVEMAKNGAITASEGSVFVVVKQNAPALVAKVDPVAPTQVVQSGTPVDVPKELQLTAVDYDSAGNIVFSGKAVPGTVVRFYVDNATTGEGKADATGAWQFAGTSAVAPGTHTLRADAVGADGMVVSRIELPFLREDSATVAAAQVALAAPVVKAAEPVSQPAAVEPAAEAPVQQPAIETQVVVAPAQPAVPAVAEAPRKLVIQPGNSLWKLSREVYGKGRMYTVIYDANRDLLKNPNKIYPGQILTAPKQP